jgi:hypothetical protein
LPGFAFEKTYAVQPEIVCMDFHQFVFKNKQQDIPLRTGKAAINKIIYFSYGDYYEKRHATAEKWEKKIAEILATL